MSLMYGGRKIADSVQAQPITSFTETDLTGVFQGNGSTVGIATVDSIPDSTHTTHLITSAGVANALPSASFFNNAGMHNRLFRGQSLGTSVSAEQYSAISDGSFENLFIGDYWTIDSIDWRIAAFDYWYGTGDTICSTHHVVIVPDQKLGDSKFGTSNYNGYYGSSMHGGANYPLGGYITTAYNKVVNTFDLSHVLVHREFLTSTTDSNGIASASTWCDSSVELMSETMAYGCLINASYPAYNIKYQYETGIDFNQLPLFFLAPYYLNEKNNNAWWLRTIANSSNTCQFDSLESRPSYASYSNSRSIRPVFAIKA